MRRILHIAVYYPKWILMLAFLLTVGAVCLIPKISLQLDGRSLIPRGDASLAESDRAAARFGLRDVVVVGVRTDRADIYTVDTLQRIERIGHSMTKLPGIAPDSITSIVSVPRLTVEGARVETGSLFRQLHGCGAQCDSVLERIRAEVQRQHLNDGILVSADGRTAAILGEVEPGADRELVLARIQALTATESGKSGFDGELFLAGSAMAQAILGQSAARDLGRLIPLVILVLTLVLALGFRHPAPALISLVEIGVSLLWTAGLMGAVEASVFVTTLVLPVILMVVGISDDVYVMSQYFGELRQHGEQGEAAPVESALIASFEKMIRPVMLTTVTTVTGLLSMTVTNLQPLRVFGFFGALSILFSSLFTFTLVPAMLALLQPRVRPVLRARMQEEAQTGATTLQAAFRALTSLRPAIVPSIALLVAMGAGLAARELHVTDNWVGNLPADSDIVHGDRMMNEHLSGTTMLDLQLDCGRSDGLTDPDAMVEIGHLERMLLAQPWVAAVRSVYGDVLRVNASLRGLNYDGYRQLLEQGRMKIDRGEIDQALGVMAIERGGNLHQWLDAERRRARMTVFIRAADYERIDALLQATTRFAQRPGARLVGILPFGDGWVSYQTVQQLVHGQIWSILAAFLTDLLLLSLLLRSVQTPLIALLPIAFSLLLMFGLLAWLGIPLGIANSMFAGIAIGIGLDYSIHLTHAYQQNREAGANRDQAISRAYQSVAPAIVTSALAIAAGCLMLVFSEVAPNRQLGLMVSLSLLLCAVATLILVPAIVLLSGARARKMPRADFARISGALLLGAALFSSGCRTGSASQPGGNEEPKADRPAMESVAIEAASSSPSVDRILSAYNSRNIGSPGSREVQMDLFTKQRLTRSFQVLNRWIAEGGEVRTLFLLTNQSGLIGTNYLLREQRNANPPDMKISLFLPAGEQRILEVTPDSFDEGLLGSDFSYSDMRMLLPTRGIQYRLAGEGKLHQERVWAVEAAAQSDEMARQVGWKRARYYFAQNFSFLLGADYFAEPGDSAPRKQMRVDRYEQVRGVWTATKILTTTGEDRYSILSLRNARFGDANFDADRLLPEELPRIAERTRNKQHILASTQPGNE